MKGQVSLEVFITLGVILAFTLPVIFLLFTVTQVGYEDTAMNQADASARALADTLNFVYSQGHPAKRTIVLNNPPNTENITIGGGEVVVRLKTSDGYYDGVASTFAEIAGEPKTIRGTGLFVLEISCNADGEVEISVPE